MTNHESPILKPLDEFRQWRESLMTHIKELIRITMDIGIMPSKTLLQMQQSSMDLDQDTLRVAFVGEFSRGKTELINALFFSTLGYRLLPSSSGQTTMCPVEIRGSRQAYSSLQVLPITSRAENESIRSLKKNTQKWQRYSIDSHDKVAQKEGLEHLTETICVPIEEARDIGLCPPFKSVSKDMDRTVCPTCGLGKVLIPRWRHAILDLNYPVLNSGLTVLDTPGLNAIGAEPELTLAILADADAILFLLGMDTGVTESDLKIWDQYIMRNPHQKQVVLLNKIDTLWDDLREEHEIRAEIKMQVEKTAKMLNVSTDQVIPVSGKQGLIGRVKQDQSLISKSGLMELENFIAEKTLPDHYATIKIKYKKMVTHIIDEQVKVLKERDRNLLQQIEKIQSIKNKSMEKIPEMTSKQNTIIQNIESDIIKFSRKKEEFYEIAKNNIFKNLSVDLFDELVTNTENGMMASWTTGKIFEHFKMFFAESISFFDRALEGAKHLTACFEEYYQDMQKNYTLPNISQFSSAIMPKRVELLVMEENYMRFGTKINIAANSKENIVQKTFLTMSNRIRDFIIETCTESERWVDELIAIMDKQINQFYQNTQEELDNLQKLEQTIQGIDSRINQIRENREATIFKINLLEQQKEKINSLLNQYD